MQLLKWVRLQFFFISLCICTNALVKSIFNLGRCELLPCCIHFCEEMIKEMCEHEFPGQWNWPSLEEFVDVVGLLASSDHSMHLRIHIVFISVDVQFKLALHQFCKHGLGRNSYVWKNPDRFNSIASFNFVFKLFHCFGFVHWNIKNVVG